MIAIHRRHRPVPQDPTPRPLQTRRRTSHAHVPRHVAPENAAHIHPQPARYRHTRARQSQAWRGPERTRRAFQAQQRARGSVVVVWRVYDNGWGCHVLVLLRNSGVAVRG
jgi:hypothetical protein